MSDVSTLLRTWDDRDGRYMTRRNQLSDDELTAIKWWRLKEANALTEPGLAVMALARWSPPLARAR